MNRFVFVSCVWLACEVVHAHAQSSQQSAPAQPEPSLQPGVSGPPSPSNAIEPALATETEPVTPAWYSIHAMLQTRYRQSFFSPSDNPRPGFALREDYLVTDHDGWRLRRAYLRLAATPTERISLKSVLDFAHFDHGELEGVVRQASVGLAIIPERIELRAGVIKRTLSIMKLDPSAVYELSDAGELTELVTDLGFAGRDLGATVMFSPLRKPKHLQLTLGAYRGHAHDERSSPIGMLGARAESKPIKGVRVGLSAMLQPSDYYYRRPFETSGKDVLPMPSDPLYPRAKTWSSGHAFGADVTFHRKRFMLRGEGIVGDRVDYDQRYGASTFYGGWALCAYRFKVGPIQLMPAARGEWLDADADHDVGARRTLALGLNVVFSDNARLLFDASYTDVDDDSPVLDPKLPLTEIPYFELDSARATGQLQIEI